MRQSRVSKNAKAGKGRKNTRKNSGLRPSRELTRATRSVVTSDVNSRKARKKDTERPTSGTAIAFVRFPVVSSPARDVTRRGNIYFLKSDHSHRRGALRPSSKNAHLARSHATPYSFVIPRRRGRNLIYTGTIHMRTFLSSVVVVGCW